MKTTKQPIRNSITSSFMARGFVPSVLVLVCIGLLQIPKALGVTPAPDGGYPGFNTAEGQNALFSVTTGVFNAAVGFDALFHNTSGFKNTATGVGALFF